MPQLFTLGELRLAADDGALLSRRGKPLVLLTFLARRAPRAVGRAELASLMWGERDESRARHSLRQTLLELHKLVGERLVITHDLVRLDTADLDLDVARFEHDVDAGDHRAALGRWQGTFLAGADDRAEADLQRWLDAERAALGRRLTIAFERTLDDAERLGNARDAADVARRWMALAPLDEHAFERSIATLRRAGHPAEALAAHTRFTARLRESGDAEPSRAFRRLAEQLDDDLRAGATPGTASALPLVGRARALAVLEDAWRRAVAGAATVALIGAVPGMGASRLADELARAARRGQAGALVLRGSGDAGAAAPGSAYATVIGMLHGLEHADALGGIAPEMLAALATLLPALRERFPHLPAAAPADAGTLAAALREAIEAVAEDVAVLVVLDPVAAADVDSRTLLLELAAGVRGAVLVLFVGADDGAAARLRERGASVVAVELSAVAEDDVATLIGAAAALPADERAALAASIRRDTGGRPAHAAAVVQALLDEGLLSTDAAHGGTLARLGGRDLPLSPALRATVLHRLGALDAEARRVADAAAVLGAPSTVSELSRLAELAPAEVERALASLARADLMAADGDRRIAPPIVERAVYALIPPLRRESLHAAASELARGPWYRRAGAGPRAAYHRTRAGGVRSRGATMRRAIPAAALALLLLVVAAGLAYRSRRAAAPDAGDGAVAVFPFAVSGESGAAYLHAGMADLLSTSLDGIGGFRTLDPRVVIAASSADVAGAALEPARARGIASRLGARYFVLGTVIGAGAELRLSAALYDVRREGGPLARASAAGGDTALFGLVDRVTAQLAVAQGGPAGERLARLAAVTTTSLDALKAYLEGRNAYRANDLFVALPAFQRAVAADSSFALAWYGLATTASWMLRPGLEQHAAAQAVRESGRLSARDRLLVEAFAAYSRGDADSAERMASTIVETYDDIEGWVLLGEVLYHHDWKRGRSLTESRRAWERVLALDPSYWPALQHLSEVAALEGHAAEADSLLGRYERSVGRPHMMLASRALRAYAFGDSASRAALDRTLATDRGFFLTASIWYVSVYGRDVASARRLAGMLVEPLRPPEQQGFGRIVLAHLDLAQGRWRESRAELAIARALAPVDAQEHLTLLSLAPFLATPPEELLRQRDALRRLPPPAPAAATLPWPRTDGALHPLLRAYLAGMASARAGDDAGRTGALAELQRLPDPTAALALGRGLALSVQAERVRQQHRPAEALTLLERGARRTPFVPAWTSAFVSQAYERYQRAELLHELGRDDDALRWYASFGENSPYDLVYVAPALYREAQIHEQRGERALAAAEYARFVELWKDCDAELRPWTADARARLAALTVARR